MILRRHLPARWRLPVACGLALAGLATPLRSAAWSHTVEVGLQQDDNVNNANREHIGDVALTASWDVSQLRGLDRDWQAITGARLQTSAWAEYSGLNLTEIGVHGTLRRKFGLGPYAPKIDLGAEATQQFSKVNGWSGQWLRGSVALHRRFTPSWQASLTGEYARLFARRAVYATAGETLAARVDCDPTATWRLSAEARYRYGDQLSWCRNRWPPFVGTVQWLDGVFEGDWFPYQDRAHQLTGRMAVERAFGGHTTLALSYEASDAHTEAGHIYLKHVFALQVIHAF